MVHLPRNTKEDRPLRKIERCKTRHHSWLIADTESDTHYTQYLATLTVLSEAAKFRKIVRYGDYNYEFYLLALDPESKIEALVDGQNIVVLTPSKFAYQFKAEDDSAAFEAVETALEDAPSLNPFVHGIWWTVRFSGAYEMPKFGEPRKK